jgi:hypothetical protein
VPKENAARSVQRRHLAAIAVALTLALALATLAGCASTPGGPDPPVESEAAPSAGAAASPAASQAASVMGRGDRGPGPGRTPTVRGITGTGVETDRNQRLRDSRLQRRERTIEGRIGTIGRQIDNTDLRRRHRLDLEHHQRFRPGPREVLLEQERRRLQSERRLVRQKRDELEFERRVDRAPQDPLTNRGRFPSRSIIQR